MKNSFPLYILARSSKGETRLFKGETTTPLVHHDVSEVLDEGFKPVLIGGFEREHTGVDIPSSPTLQINGDMSGLSDVLLLELARAELFRVGAQDVKAYTVEPDRSVAVLSTDHEELSRFVKTWGGVIHVIPILLGHNREGFVSAKDLEVKISDEGGLTLHILESSPVDTSLCTGCGACSWVCPEGCIKPGPFIDLDSCSFCGECSKVCELGAIDLHAAFKRAIHCSFLVILQDLEGDARFETLPGGEQGGIRRIYHENAMEELFSNIFTYEVEEVITMIPGLCQYSPRLKRGCTRCLDACAVNALRPGTNGIEIDHVACTGCGACVATCPTGAMQYEKFKEETFFHYLNRLVGGLSEKGLYQADWTKDRTVYIGTGDVLEEVWWNRGRRKGIGETRPFFIEHPQPAAVSSTALLLLLSMGFRQVRLITEDEESLPPASSCQISMAREIGGVIFGRNDLIELVPVSSVIEALGTGASPDGELGVSSTHGHQLQNNFPGRRPLLAAIIRGHGDGLERIGLFSDGNFHCEGDHYEKSPFQDLKIDPTLCTHCLACLNECKTMALSANEDDMSLRFTPILCVACNICTDSCPEGALIFKPGLFFDQGFFEDRRLFSAEPAICSRCGKVFGVKKSLERVKTILSARGDIHADLFELCEDCRVRWLFERAES